MKEKHWQALPWVTRKSNELGSDAVALDGERNLLLKPSLRLFERKTLGDVRYRRLGKRRYFCRPDRLREDGEVDVKST